MDEVQGRLTSPETDFIRFLKTRIKELETDKKETVGVFGRSGAGKSSLINAILGEENLLPTGFSKACTSVMIKIESNTKNEYEAHIEFITKAEWKEEWWVYQKEDQDDIAEKCTAVYGEGWRDLENLFDEKHFREIPEFLESKPKIIKHKTAEKLSEEYQKFIRSETSENEGTKKWYWPLVKCVTLKVPNADILQNITLVDLPGNGDRNESRNKLWKEIVGRCSTVWIVTDGIRAASDRDAWEILEDASSIMGNGGECQKIHFICNKSDQIEKVTSDITNNIKEDVKKEFRRDEEINKHFSEGCLEVFTVSARDSLEGQLLHPDVNEMAKLQHVLRNLSDHHSKTLRYVDGARGILSLIDGARRAGMAEEKNKMRLELKDIITSGCSKIRTEMEKAHKVLEKCLNDGVEKSKNSCEAKLNSVIDPKKDGRGFHKTLRSIVEKGGVHITSNKKTIDLNMTLSSSLISSIDKEFREIFPNERKRGAFNNAIKNFSLGTDELTKKYKGLELQLIFLKTEEDKIKTKLNTTIRERKKRIYHSLTKTIEARMKDAYDNASKIRGQNSLKNMRETLQNHVKISKADMFREAKDRMLRLLKKLQDNSLKELEETLLNSIELSLSTDDASLPDVSADLEKVKKFYDELKSHLQQVKK
ncbi:unnamed protein product [Ophioblennius macclurei]